MSGESAIRITAQRPLRGPNMYAPRPLWRLQVHVGDPGDSTKAAQRLAAAGLDVADDHVGGLIASTALALQREAGIPGTWHHAEPGPEDDMVVLFEYEDEAAAEEAGRQAVALVQSEGDLTVPQAVDAVRAARRVDTTSPSIQALRAAASQRGIPVMDRGHGHHQLGWGHKQEQLWNTVPGRSSSLGFDIASDLARTLEVLQGSGIGVADGAGCRGARACQELVDRIGLPVVATPEEGEPMVVADEQQLQTLSARMEADDDWYFIQQQVPGEPRRVLVVGNKVVGAIRSSDGADITDTLPPALETACRRAARLVGLDLVAVDLVGDRLVALDPAPSLEPFLARGAAQKIIARQFPQGQGRIPLVAVTGTNGKTTTVRLLAHILKYAGARVGMAATGVLEVENQVIMRGDYSGPTAARTVLREPGVTHAVCEVARGGILRSGLGFDACDVGVLLNVTGDHLGEGGIDTMEDLIRVKSTVLGATREGGTVVLNMDDPGVWDLRASIDRTIIPFTLDPHHPDLEVHLAGDPSNVAVTVEDGAIVVRGQLVTTTGPDVVDIPLTLDGAARFNIQNAMAATAAATAIGLDEPAIRAGLVSFHPSARQSPGRMNLMHIGDIKVMVDYGHNVAALEAIADVLPRLTRGRKLNVACCAGNRRDEDLEAFGKTIAGMYDRIYVDDADPRGRPPGETPRFIAEAIRATGFPEDQVVIEPDEMAAAKRALADSRPGDLVVLQVDDVERMLRFCQDLQARIEAGESAAEVVRGARAEAV